jgi:hypothetical protein
LELVQHGRDVIGHGKIHVFLGIIPLNGEPAEQSSVPIFGVCVEFAECPKEVQGVLFSDVLDAEMVNEKREVDGTSVMFPKGRRDGYTGRYPNLAKWVVSWSLAMQLACFKPSMPFWISM